MTHLCPAQELSSRHQFSHQPVNHVQIAAMLSDSTPRPSVSSGDENSVIFVGSSRLEGDSDEGIIHLS